MDIDCGRRDARPRLGTFFRHKRPAAAPARSHWLCGPGLVFGLLIAAPALAAPPQFLADGQIASDTGYAMIEWTGPGLQTLEMAKGSDLSRASEVYSGTNTAYFVSGLADGEYTFVLRAPDGAVSQPLSLSVAHQSLSRAFWLAGLGALAFLAIIFAILRGARDD